LLVRNQALNQGQKVALKLKLVEDLVSCLTPSVFTNPKA